MGPWGGGGGGGRERERNINTQIHVQHCFNITNLPRVGGKSLELASWCQGRSRALDRGRGQGDETSGMADHQLCNPWQREGSEKGGGWGGGASGNINTHFSHCVMTMLLFEQKHTAKYQPKHTPKTYTL